MVQTWVAMLAAAAATGAGPAPLQPVGKWNLEYAESMCVAPREFGTAGSGIFLALRPLPMGDAVELFLVMPGSRIEARLGQGKVTLTPGNTVLEGSYVTWSTKEGNRRVLSMTVNDHDHALSAATTIAISGASKAPIVVASTKIDKVMEAMVPCQRSLLTSWKIDPDANDKVATPPEPKTNIVNWISSRDYPPAVLRQGQYGNTTILWKIGTDGLVGACRVVGQSGNDELDAAACQAITKRGRYTPATDKDGKPVVSYMMRRVIWRLPG